jgi:tRNA modification GTPase
LTEIDTITAISTPLGEGGIGIIRISGPEAFAVARRIFVSTKDRDPGYPRSHYLYYGHIVNQKKEVIDEVLVSFMEAPHTYTREDTVEINCHSGIFTLRMTMNLVLKNGARLAEPGEFTRRAYLNGRIDLSQAESVLRIIKARSEQAVKIAACNIQGRLSEKTKALRDKILSILARIEAVLDFPEEVEEDPGMMEEIKKGMEEIIYFLQEILQGAERGIIYQEGIDTAIVGKPNVGKSSLLNALLRQQRAIVHEMPGTTRDVLEGYLSLAGYPIRLLDTAGMHGTEDPVEREGIARTRRAAERAKLLLIVLDGSTCWSEADQAVTELIQPEQIVVMIINKADLRQKISTGEIRERFPGISIVKTAVIKNKGIGQLEEEITGQLDRKLGKGGESPLLLSMRHQEIVNEALQSIEKAIYAIDVQPLELVSIDLHEAWAKLGEVTGETVSDELLDRIFSEFCLGK